MFFFYSTLAYDDISHYSKVDFPDASFDYDLNGFHVIDNFITEQEEKEMMESIDSKDWSKLMMRRVQHYGFEFNYRSRDVNPKQKLCDMPDFIDFMLPKIESAMRCFEIPKEGPAVKVREFGNDGEEEIKSEGENYFETHGHFDQLTVNDYKPGQGIPPHVDTHSPFEEIFASVSLRGATCMSFKNDDDE